MGIGDLWDLLGRPWSPRCGLWSPPLMRAANLSDLATLLAYYCFPVLGVAILWRARPLPSPWLVAVAAAFLATCGAEHGLDVLTHFTGNVALLTAAKVATAVMSWVAVAVGVAVCRESRRGPRPRLPALPAGSARRLLRVGLMIAVAKGGVLYLGYRTLDAIARQSVYAEQRSVAYRRCLDLRTLAGMVCEAETGQRGYLLTRDPRYLVPYTAAVADLRGREAEWSPAVGPKLAELAGTVAQARAGRWAEAEAAVRTGLGLRLMADVRREVEDRIAAIEAEIRAADADWQGTNRAIYALTPTVGLTSVALVLAALGLAVRDGNRRAAAERDAADADWGRRSAEADATRVGREMAARIRMFNSISHDLRNPIQAMSLGVDLIEAALAGNAPPVVSRSLDDIRAQLRVATDDLESLLDAARAGEGRPRRLAHFSLAAIAARVLAGVQREADHKGLLIINLVPDVEFYGHESSLVRIIQNLLTNAVKYTPRGTVVVSATRHADGSTSLAVRDTGPGVDPAVLPHLFGEFVQGGNPERDPHKGFGLGLAIVKQLSHRMGGDVSVRSEPGRGAEFIVTLPACPPEVCPEIPQEVPAWTSSSRPPGSRPTSIATSSASTPTAGASSAPTSSTPPGSPPTSNSTTAT